MRNITNFNDAWKFSKDNHSFEDVRLPHTWNNYDGQDGNNDYYRGRCLYTKSFSLNQLPNNECHYLEINGANSKCEVYLNKKILCTHSGGYSTFRLDMTDYLLEENILEIFVDNSDNDSIYPQVADFTFYGGLYRDVNIISVPELHFDLSYFGSKGLKVEADVSGTVNIEVFTSKKATLFRYSLYDTEKNLIAELYSQNSKEKLFCPSVHLWHGKKDPYLYTVKAQIIENSKPIDEVIANIGFRNFKIDSKNGFILNNEEYPLRGVSRHQDRKNKGNAISKEDHLEDMNLIRELGANTIRLAHYQHDQYFYDLCDKYGLIVWAEIPYISKHSPNARDNSITQMTELIVQNYNHPSIIVWGISNEITMSSPENEELLENHKILNNLCHSLDNTRLTTSAMLSTCSIDSKIVHLTDVVSYNHYFGWYGGSFKDNGPWFDNFHKEYPDRAIGCSEYGCEALSWHTSEPRQGDYTEEYQALYHEELIKALFSRKYLWATHVWNMFDFGADARNEGGENGQNHKGLVTFDRSYKKDAFYAYKAYLSDEKFIHICSKRYIDRVEDLTLVTVYSNLETITLYVNDTIFDTKTSEDHFFKFMVPNVGRSTLRATSGSYSDQSEINKVDTFNESYRLKETGAVLNWFDIKEIDGYLSLNSNISDVFKTVPGSIALSIALFKKFKFFKKDKTNVVSSMDKKTLIKTIGGFSVLRVATMASTLGVKFTKKELLSLNKKLNKIKIKH